MLFMDTVQQANSGHPGTPMALAPVVYCLWQSVHSHRGAGGQKHEAQSK